MADEKRPQPREDSPSDVPGWMVTFSDCMTLLLCFFVLLLTFSSFDEISLDKLGGAFPGLTYDSIFPNKRTITDSLVPPKPREADYTHEGSEKPTDAYPKDIDNPKAAGPKLPPDAYRDYKTVRVRSDRVFFAKGTALTDEGRDLAATLAGFLRRMPCKTILSENCPASSDGTPARALALVKYLTGECGLPDELFSVAASRTDRTDDDESKPTMVITMISGELYK
jgi:hypothetical protein